MKLEVQVVEKAIEVVKKPRERKKAISSMNNKGKTKKEKKSKNPNLPKRPPTAFFLFMWSSMALVMPLIISIPYLGFILHDFIVVLFWS